MWNLRASWFVMTKYEPIVNKKSGFTFAWVASHRYKLKAFSMFNITKIYLTLFIYAITASLVPTHGQLIRPALETDPIVRLLEATPDAQQRILKVLNDPQLKKGLQVHDAWMKLPGIGTYCVGIVPDTAYIKIGEGFTLELPFFDNTMVLERPRLTLKGDFFSLSGNLVELDWRTRYTSYTKAIASGSQIDLYGTLGKSIRGSLRYLGKSYVINGLNKNYIVIAEDYRRFGLIECRECYRPGVGNTIDQLYQSNTIERGSISGISSTHSNEAVSMAEEIVGPSSGICVVDVAFGFTDSAAYYANFIYDEGEKVVVSMNDILGYSDISNFRYRNAGTFPLVHSSYQNDHSLSDALLAIRLDNEGEVGVIENDTKADQFMLIAGSYTADGKVGTSELLNAPQFRDQTVIRTGYDNLLVGPHELGHNHGCKHENDNSSGTAAQLNYESRAFEGFDTNFVFRSTVMVSVTGPGNDPVEYYSSPSNQTQYGILGTQDRDNRSQMKETGCFVSQFRKSLPTDDDITIYALSSDFDGGANVEFQAVSFCNDGEYGSRVWKLALGSGGYNQVAVTGGDYVNFNLPHLSRYPQLAYLRLESKCANNTTPEVDTYAFYITAPYETLPETPQSERKSTSGTNYDVVFAPKDPQSFALVSYPETTANAVTDVLLVTFTDFLGRSRILDAHFAGDRLSSSNNSVALYNIDISLKTLGAGYLTVFTSSGSASTIVNLR